MKNFQNKTKIIKVSKVIRAILFAGLVLWIGHGVFQVSDAWNSGGLFAGLALVFVAWLLKEAQGLQEEQELTV